MMKKEAIDDMSLLTHPGNMPTRSTIETSDIYLWFKDLRVFTLQTLVTALAGGLGQMSLVNDYQMFRPNLGSSSVVVKYRA